MSDKRISFKVSGRVQGVNFRSFTCKQARSMDITGFVTNDSDGTVRGEAQGTADDIKQFLQHLEKGPSAARVTQAEHSDMACTSGESDFNVK